MSDEEQQQAEGGDTLATWVTYGICILCFAATIPILSKVPRSRGRSIVAHVIFWITLFLLNAFLPDVFADVLFSPGSVLVVGTLLPVYESVVAACTVGQADDVEWLQFWIVNATFTYATEWMDSLAETWPLLYQYWYPIELGMTLWFLLPWTDGSTLIYDVFTKPVLAPLFKTAKKYMDGRIQVILAVVNSGYLWILWSTFLTLPEEARRFVVVAVGTVYPILASTVSITAETEEETFWLTYWSSFSLLFVAMDYLENFVGQIRGFYSICLCATVYLFLPMFGGADVVFRRVLVPLFGQYEELLLRDALLVKREMAAKLPPNLHDAAFLRAATVFMGAKATETTAKKES